MRLLSSRWIYTKLTSSTTFSCSTSSAASTSLKLLLGVAFDRTLSFCKHVPSLKAKFFPRFKALRCISASSWDLSQESFSLLCVKLFFGPFSHMLCLDSFLSLVLPSWNVFTEQLFTPSPATSRSPLSHFTF